VHISLNQVQMIVLTAGGGGFGSATSGQKTVEYQARLSVRIFRSWVRPPACEVVKVCVLSGVARLEHIFA